jgi:hypothetical protein
MTKDWKEIPTLLVLAAKQDLLALQLSQAAHSY